jgi:hypothetical protein
VVLCCLSSTHCRHSSRQQYSTASVLRKPPCMQSLFRRTKHKRITYGPTAPEKKLIPRAALLGIIFCILIKLIHGHRTCSVADRDAPGRGCSYARYNFVIHYAQLQALRVLVKKIIHLAMTQKQSAQVSTSTSERLYASTCSGYPYCHLRSVYGVWDRSAARHSFKSLPRVKIYVLGGRRCQVLHNMQGIFARQVAGIAAVQLSVHWYQDNARVRSLSGLHRSS